ncbi:hypothetical protein GCM10011571_11620 [Marinithermofilum abyssi]|uniref:Uncharacterized protein n=1 Tax=Marinithermofilum abyssi TaxID=1571185 RepID=A0A8J2VEM1_9BACL|nr:hypothetical protein [Marinithermofilum abyssi]GGE11939.1 hypothetical protein GCM10011571_11620 [Marinithermofilum abyssi]
MGQTVEVRSRNTGKKEDILDSLSKIMNKSENLRGVDQRSSGSESAFAASLVDAIELPSSAYSG